MLGRSLHFSLAQPKLALNAQGRRGRLLARLPARSPRAGWSRPSPPAFRPAGERFGLEQKVRDGGPYQDVTLDDRGDLYAVWTTYGGPVNRFAYKLRGKRVGRAADALRPRCPSNPTIAVTPDRSAVVAWRAADVDSEGDGIQYGAVYVDVRSPDGVFGDARRSSPTRACTTCSWPSRRAARR